ncbi:MAG: FkbM family methyltransferase [Acidilobus sp.]
MAELLSPDKIKEKALKALSVRKLMERGWLSALLGYLAKRDELKVRLKYIGDVTLRRTDFEALAANAYYTAKCWPQLPTELAKAAGSLLKPQEALYSLLTALSLARYACKLQRLGKKVSINIIPEGASLEVNGISAAFSFHCVSSAFADIFIKGKYEFPEVLSGLRGRDVIDVEASAGDTALYFVLNGARKVIALEPLPNVARCAEENVRLSGATDKVKVINAALSYEPASVPCDYDVLSSRYFSTLSASGPCKVPGVTLGDLLNMVDDPYLLKMDCEGCESQVILGPEREKLRAFEHVVFEAHPEITGVSNEKLLASLKELGFECRPLGHGSKLDASTYYCKNLTSKTA